MPLSPEARRALESMNRGPLKHPPTETPPAARPEPSPGEDRAAADGNAPVTPEPARRPSRRPASRVSGAPAIAGRVRETGEHLGLPPHPPDAAPLLEHLVPGTVVTEGSRSHYLHQRVLHAPLSEGRMLGDELMRLYPGRHAGRDVTGSPSAAPAEELLLLDIETTGLFNGPLFLVGVLTLDSGGLTVRQLFARDYSEEAGVLEATHDLLGRRPGLVTFNGKSFDLPYIANRCAYHRVPMPVEQSHTDLLLIARRRWRRFLPNCRLQTIEQQVCQRYRVGDIPGEMMGQVYHDFVRTGDATQIRKVFHHNLLDLVAMAEMLYVLAGSTND